MARTKGKKDNGAEKTGPFKGKNKKALISVALVHFPVYNQDKKIVNTAITCLSIHDIARVFVTYNIDYYFIINSLKSQQKLVRKILKFWSTDEGISYNRSRTYALKNVKVMNSLVDVHEFLKRKHGSAPSLVSTTARNFPNSVAMEDFREKIRCGDENYLLLFGTGWGLTDEILMDSDYVLEPIAAYSVFNHLSVRSAASIIIDRIMS